MAYLETEAWVNLMWNDSGNKLDTSFWTTLDKTYLTDLIIEKLMYALAEA